MTPYRRGVDCSDHCWRLDWLFWPNFFAKCIFYMYPEAAKKMWAIFFWFSPLKQLFFSEGVQISREGVLLAQEPPLWKSAARHFWWAEQKLWWAVFFSLGAPGCPDFQRGGSAGRGTPSLEIGTPSLEKDDVSHSRSSRLGIIKIMNADIIEVKTMNLWCSVII